MTSARGLLTAARLAVPPLLLAILLIPVPGRALTESPEEADLRGRIEARLEALSDRQGAEIEVRVRGEQVLLLGRVRLLEQSLRAEQAAWTTPGVIEVENELQVVRTAEGLDDVIEQRVRLIIKGDERFLDTNLKVSVEAGAVRIQGLFQDPGDVLALKHRIASIPGVLDLEIEALLVARHRPSPARDGPLRS